jgi:hypothetical protein
LTTSKSYPMTMGFDDDGDTLAGGTEEAVDNVEDRMDYEETTEEFVRNLEKNSASSLQKEAERSAPTSTSTGTMATATATATGLKKTTGMKSTIGTGEEGMELEQTAETPRWQLRKNSRSSSSTSTSTRTMTAATGMKNIEEEDEEQEDEEED